MMRTALLALTLPFAFLLVAQVKSDAQKPDGKKPDVGAGRIAWFDITTTDMAKSKEFYGKLFDWKFTTIPQTNLAVEIVASDVSIGTLRVAEGKISAFNGVVYVQVPNIEESCKKAKELGAALVSGFPFDLSDDRGSIGLFNDPVGHPLGMYSRTPLAKEKPVK